MVLGRPSSAPGGPTGVYYLIARILSAATRLETSTSISLTLSRLRQWKASRGDKIKYTFMVVVASICFYVMTSPPFPYKLAIPGLFTVLILVPITSQFFLPAAPILLYLLIFFSSQFVPAPSRPHIWVSVLPTLETILYGGSISDILTRFGHPLLDILAWIPYGVGHFVMPFVVAAFIFVFAPPGATKFFGAAFGFMNVFAVIMQFLFPCAPPWYELREGLTPANYGMKGSPAGLARIDALFHSHGYTSGFTNAPVPFGAFPSLHAADATIEALFCSYFFPLMLEIPIPFSGSGKGARKRLRLDARILYWAYAFWLYWCTMYLMHHYLVDLVGGSCLATISFYYFLTDEMRVAMEQNYAYRPSEAAPMSAAPPANYPREAFGTRSSMDLARLSNGGEGGRPHLSSIDGSAGGVRMKDMGGKANGGSGSGKSNDNKVLFQVDEGREEEDDDGNDWGNSDDEETGEKSTTASASHSGR
ncbi:PAP2-domain-containing protein [Acaromyces ingoldii]|uniref:PAP2-domain-containing protein n=1 Tax=Acaromyces ingoldii TaxID=215250 RepID=A0A316YSS6_9BASI|nr:PAP2-domain-containing protein [Acaromyces ingoldii]PWN92172.1 PAP2-domain-containing protein [Acaromyces ingoldii]